MKLFSILGTFAASVFLSGCAAPGNGVDRNSLRVGGIVCLELRGIRLVTSDMTETQLDSIRCMRTPRALPFRVVGTSTNPPALQIAVDFKSGMSAYWTRLQDTNLN